MITGQIKEAVLPMMVRERRWSIPVGDIIDLGNITAGGNGMALGAIAAWFVIRRPEAERLDEELDSIGVLVSAMVILLLPLVVDSADFWSGITGGAVGVVHDVNAV